MGLIEDPTRTIYDLSILYQNTVESFVKYVQTRDNISDEEKRSLLSGLVDLDAIDEPEKTKTSSEVFATAYSLWTESLISGLGRPRPESGGIEIQKRDTVKSVGSLYLFSYNPVTKQKLEFYDTFPLVLITGVQRGKFSGVNLHFVPPIQRMSLMQKLLGDFNPKIEGSFNGINFSYLNTDEGRSIVKPCYRTYFDQRISSINIMSIGPEDWVTAARMPLERFRKLSRESVWANTRRKQDNG